MLTHRTLSLSSVVAVASVAYVLRAMTDEAASIGGFNVLLFVMMLATAGYCVARTFLSRPTLLMIAANRGSARTGLKKFSPSDSLE